MGNILKVIAVGMGLLIAIYFIAKFAGIIEVYRLPTSSMAPTFPPGKIIYASKLIKPNYGDAICFKTMQPDNDKPGKLHEEIRMQRLIAKGGDTLELKDGYAFVNDFQVDKEIPLLFLYKSNDVNANQKLFSEIPDYAKNPAYNMLFLFLTDDQYKNLSSKISIERLEVPNNSLQTNPIWTGIADQSWSNSNFGPVIVPENHVFVLGDNRDNAADSRVIGFIPERDIVSKVIFP
ncbi:MAG: signal peptidase I [Saprospiraceae bacterium]